MTGQLSNGERKEERHTQTDVAFRKARRGERAKRVGIVIVAIALTAILGITCYTAILIRQQQVQNAPIAQNTNATAKQVRELLFRFNDCINPNGQCAQDNAEATAKVLQELKASTQQIVLYQGVCEHTRGVDPGNPHDMAVCVAHLLNEREGT